MLVQAAAPLQETPVTAPPVPPPAAVESEQTGLVDAVVISASARGKVEGPVQPELTLQAEEIQATGASTVQELVALLDTEITGNDPDAPPPVYLVNGRRISGFHEISGLPSQAIQRMEVLPEAAALSYGYQPNQKVVNFVLRSHFRSLAVEGEERQATAGGRTTERFAGDLFRLSGDNRTTVGVNWQQDSALFEAERDIVRAPSATSPYGLPGNVAGSPLGSEIDPALSALAGHVVTLAGASGLNAPSYDGITANRSLSPKLGQGVFKGAVTRDIAHQVSVTLSVNLDDARRISFLGLPGTSVRLPVGSPFSPFGRDVIVYRYLDAATSEIRTVEAFKGQLGLAANGYVGDWRWSLTGNYDHLENDTVTGRGVDSTAWKAAIAARDPGVDPFGPVSPTLLKANPNDTASSRSDAAKAELVLNGAVVEVPAGQITSTLKVGGESVSQASDALRSGVSTQSDFDRRTVSLQGDVDVPLTSRTREVAPLLGDLTVSLNAGYDVDSRRDRVAFGAGAHWSPVQIVTVNLNVSQEETAPSAGQIADPVVLTPSVTIFDFTTGQSLTVNRMEGGNAALMNDRRRVLRAGVNVRPIGRDGGPTRVTVNLNYVRTRIDDPISNFPLITPALEAAFPERFTHDASGNLTAIDSRPLNFDAIDRAELRGGVDLTHFLGKTAPGAKPRKDKRAGQVQLALNYLWRLRDETTLKEGLAPLDLLAGASTSRRGQPRHELNARLNLFRRGFGANLAANWRGESRIDAGAANGGSLRFAPQTTLNLSAFYEFPREATTSPWLAGARVTLAADNLFDTRPIVKDAHGLTPQAYQADYLDPLGRMVRLTLRKSLIAL